MKHRDKTDTSAWVRQAMEEHEGPLLRYSWRLTGDLESARDAVQETFMRLCRQKPSALDGRLPAWLFTVCRNLSLDLLRKEGRMTPLTDTQLAVRPSDDPSPATIAAQHDAENQILRLLDALPANQQEVVRLKFQNGLSYKEISVVTKLSVTNVGFLIHTALKTIRQQWQTLEGVQS
jgi:RNA polymerase sigma-70 factor (ECF subfamily)